jgi:type VI protein secretion system component Hcp
MVTRGTGASRKEANAGRAAFPHLEISKLRDNSRPALTNHCATGDILSQVHIWWGTRSAIGNGQ